MEGMTILDVCKTLEEIISELSPESRDGDWLWSFIEAKSDEAHVEDARTQLRLTREHYNTEGDQEMHAVFLGDAVLALTGVSPTSKARARYMAAVSPRLVMALIDEIRAAHTRSGGR